MTNYVGRFAPSPSGPLHAGSLTTALASWLDARAHGGQWLVRIEDIDTERCRPDWAHHMMGQLACLGLVPDAPPVWQSARSHLYASACAQLADAGHMYGCDCSRREIRTGQSSTLRALIYLGTCRAKNLTPDRRLAWRVHLGHEKENTVIAWTDRCLGPQVEDLQQTVGDFVLRRREGAWAYQLAVVVDDAAQGVTHVVRGQDLASNTARQIYLQRLLKLPLPQYLHSPLVRDTQGRKLSKHLGAPEALVNTPEKARSALQESARTLGLHVPAEHWLKPTLAEGLEAAVQAWKIQWAVA